MALKLASISSISHRRLYFVAIQRRRLFSVANYCVYIYMCRYTHTSKEKEYFTLVHISFIVGKKEFYYFRVS